MPKKILSFFALFALILSVFPQQSLAAGDTECDRAGIHISLKDNKLRYDRNEPIVATLSIDDAKAYSLDPNSNYGIRFVPQTSTLNILTTYTKLFTGNADQFVGGKTLTFDKSSGLTGYPTLALSDIDDYVLTFSQFQLGGLWHSDICSGPHINIVPNGLSQMQCKISLPKNVKYGTSVPIDVQYEPKNKDIEYKLQFFENERSINDFSLTANWPDQFTYVSQQILLTNQSQVQTPNTLPLGKYTAVIRAASPDRIGTWYYGCAVASFEVSQASTSTDQSGSKSSPGAGLQETTQINTRGTFVGTGPVSKAVGAQCNSIFNDNKGIKYTGIETAIGCVPTNPTAFIQAFFKLSVGIGGGIAFLMMLYGAFEMIASAGNPESLKAGQQRFTSAIYGILFVVFAIFLLEVIGVDILGLEGFGR